MQRQRGELVPIAEVIADLPGPVQAFREAEPPARRGFIVADQVHQLVSASEADPERGFMARLMVLCSAASGATLGLALSLFAPRPGPLAGPI